MLVSAFFHCPFVHLLCDFPGSWYDSDTWNKMYTFGDYVRELWVLFKPSIFLPWHHFGRDGAVTASLLLEGVLDIHILHLASIGVSHCGWGGQRVSSLLLGRPGSPGSSRGLLGYHCGWEGARVPCYGGQWGGIGQGPPSLVLGGRESLVSQQGPPGTTQAMRRMGSHHSVLLGAAWKQVQGGCLKASSLLGCPFLGVWLEGASFRWDIRSV